MVEAAVRAGIRPLRRVTSKGSLHDNGGACSGTAKRLLTSSNYGQSQEWEWVPCGCHGYDGPEPLPRVWTPFPQLPAALPLDDVRRIG